MNDVLDRLKLALPDRYIVEAEIGRESLDIRYRARDRQLDQLVIIRALRPELADCGVSPFFLRECDLLNRLDHPQIVCVHEVAEAAMVCYMVTEHLHGETLQARLTREGQIPIVDAVEIASDLAEGLSHAHARGVVLRAVEPRCVTLVPGRPVITDFRYAYAPAEGDELAEDGLFVGPPFYMSPEIVSGDSEGNTRSDVYSLGTVLYEMLTGELPFDGRGMRAIVEQILHGPPLSFTGVRPAVPECFQRVVKTATARKPEERYQTAEEFREALALALDDVSRVRRKLWWYLTDRLLRRTKA